MWGVVSGEWRVFVVAPAKRRLASSWGRPLGRRCVRSVGGVSGHTDTSVSGGHV